MRGLKLIVVIATATHNTPHNIQHCGHSKEAKDEREEAAPANELHEQQLGFAWGSRYDNGKAQCDTSRLQSIQLRLTGTDTTGPNPNRGDGA